MFDISGPTIFCEKCDRKHLNLHGSMRNVNYVRYHKGFSSTPPRKIQTENLMHENIILLCNHLQCTVECALYKTLQVRNMLHTQKAKKKHELRSCWVKTVSIIFALLSHTCMHSQLLNMTMRICLGEAVWMQYDARHRKKYQANALKIGVDCRMCFITTAHIISTQQHTIQRCMQSGKYNLVVSK